ncbi:DUF6122 family protein [Zhouia sp. PK063]|uniref:DUF6122 family protein n=1 Tax=Zhouia sp. PK063 TaxID=3373602 RepID=UPI00379AB3BC
MLRFFIHYGIHFIGPVIIAALFYRNNFWKSLLILEAGILIDIDHLWANPIFDPNRCSINFHLFHQYYFIIFYIALLFYKPTRIFGIALLVHILADITDCLLM